MITGYITRGTTVSGRAVNAGETVELDEDQFRKLLNTGDVEAIKAPEPEKVAEQEPAAKPKHRSK